MPVFVVGGVHEPQATKRALVWDLVINAFIPWLLYYYLTAHRGYSEYHGLLAATIIPALAALFGLLKRRRLDPVASITLATIGISLALVGLSDDPRVLLLRESYLSALIGVALGVSALIGRPLLWLLLLKVAQDPRQVVFVSSAIGKRLFTHFTWIWAAVCLLEFAIKVVMIERLETGTVLALSPFVFYGTTAVGVLVTVLWVRRLRSRVVVPAQALPTPESPVSEC